MERYYSKSTSDKAEIEKKKELEILDGKYTKKLETRPFWRISVDK